MRTTAAKQQQGTVPFMNLTKGMNMQRNLQKNTMQEKKSKRQCKKVKQFRRMKQVASMRARSSAVSAHKEVSDHTTSLSLDFGTIHQLQVASSMETTKIFTLTGHFTFTSNFAN